MGLNLGGDLSDFFFLEFVYGLLHVRLYLGWDLSDFIYLFISEFVSGPLLSQFFFFKIVLVLLNWSLIKLGLLNYFFLKKKKKLWLKALNFDDNFILGFIKKKKKLGLKIFFFLGPINFFWEP
jgi:hypothetical protein